MARESPSRRRWRGRTTTLEAAARSGFRSRRRPLADATFDAATIEAECKYRGYLKRHDAQLARTRRRRRAAIPAEFEYAGIPVSRVKSSSG